MNMEDKTFVSGRELCRRFNLTYYTLQNIVQHVGDKKMGRHRIPGMKHHRFELKKAEKVLRGEPCE